MTVHPAEQGAGGLAYHRDFRDAVCSMAPGEHIMVFIRYAPNHSPHMSLVTNEPDLNAARVWTVYDRGATTFA